MKIKSLSASKFKSHDQCAFKYFMENHLRIKGEEGFAARMGSAIHEILERYAFARRDGNDAEWCKKNKLVLSPLTTEQIEELFEDMLLTFWRKQETEPLWRAHKWVLREEKACDKCDWFEDGVCGIVKQPVESIIGHAPTARGQPPILDPNYGCPYNEFYEGVRQLDDVISDNKPYSPLSRKILDIEKWFSLKLNIL